MVQQFKRDTTPALPILTSLVGDGDLRGSLEDRAEKADVQPYLKFYTKLPSVVANNAKSAPPSKTILRNPFEGEAAAKQLSESMDDFLHRLPPSKSTSADVGPWIWVANPHVEHHPVQQDLAGLIEQGTKLLNGYDTFRVQVQKEMQGKAPSVITRKLTPKRKALEADLRDAALNCKVTSGKWMLFPSSDKLDRTWKIVAEATANGKLGSMAKVATAGSEREQNVRLICVYTEDFSNQKDVRRVLEELVELGLVRRDSEKGNWYKCDAYTHLGIESGNEYGLRASMYGSKDFLKGKK